MVRLETAALAWPVGSVPTEPQTLLGYTLFHGLSYTTVKYIIAYHNFLNLSKILQVAIF